MWLLTQTLPGTEQTVFGALRERAATPAVRIWAAGAPFETKDELRARGYRWMPTERDGIPRSWWTADSQNPSTTRPSKALLLQRATQSFEIQTGHEPNSGPDAVVRSSLSRFPS